MTSLWNRTLEYVGYNSRESLNICKDKDFENVDENYLGQLFNTQVTSENKRELIQKLEEDCENIINTFENSNYAKDIASKIYSFIPREFTYPENLSFEIVLNLIMFFVSLKVSWSEYLLYFPSGQKLLYNIFQSPSSTLYFFTIIKSVYLNKSYDELLFKQEMFKILPNLNSFLPQTLANSTMLWINDQLSTKALLAIYSNYSENK